MVTFSDTGKFVASGACAGGSGYYLQTQTGEIMVSGFIYPATFCGTLDNETQSRIYDALEDVYSFELNDNSLTLRSRLTTTPYLYLSKLP